jgi:hypothetical protein
MRQLYSGFKRLEIAIFITLIFSICLTSFTPASFLDPRDTLWFVTAIVTVHYLLKAIQYQSVSTTNRNSLRSKRFWLAFWFIIPLVGSLNLLSYWKSNNSGFADGMVVMGWPLDFYRCGGFTGEQFYSPAYLLIDILFCISIALAIAYVMRNGSRWLAVKVVKLLNNRT